MNEGRNKKGWVINLHNHNFTLSHCTHPHPHSYITHETLPSFLSHPNASHTPTPWTSLPPSHPTCCHPITPHALLPSHPTHLHIHALCVPTVTPHALPPSHPTHLHCNAPHALTCCNHHAPTVVFAWLPTNCSRHNLSTNKMHQMLMKSQALQTPAASKIQNKVHTRELNGVPPMDIDVHNLSSSPHAAVTLLMLTPDSLSITPTSKSPPNANIPPYNLTAPHNSLHNPNGTEPFTLTESTNTAILGHNTLSQMHIKLPSPPLSPSLIFSSWYTFSGYSCGIVSKHTLLFPWRITHSCPACHYKVFHSTCSICIVLLTLVSSMEKPS